MSRKYQLKFIAEWRSGELWERDDRGGLLYRNLVGSLCPGDKVLWRYIGDPDGISRNIVRTLEQKRRGALRDE